jgi:hypothetical protein
MGFIENLRQWFYPREFRIRPPLWPADLHRPVEQAAHRPDDSSTGVGDNWLPQVATHLWRARQKMLKPGTNEPLDEMRRAFRHIESIWEVLKQAGVEIHDHTGDRYDPGMSLKVLAFQEAPEIEGEQVIETVKPSIYLRGRIVQPGEVIVGRPGGDDLKPGDA